MSKKSRTTLHVPESYSETPRIINEAFARQVCRERARVTGRVHGLLPDAKGGFLVVPLAYATEPDFRVPLAESIALADGTFS